MTSEGPGGPPLILAERDVGDIADLYARCTDYFLFQDGEAATPADASDLFGDVPEGKTPADQTIWGWRSGNRLTAVAAVLPDYPRNGIWYLGFLIVDPTVRGQGIGRSMYACIERRAAGCGADEIRLAVLEANEAAAGFWRSLGYEQRRRVGPDTFKSRRHRRIELTRRIRF